LLQSSATSGYSALIGETGDLLFKNSLEGYYFGHLDSREASSVLIPAPVGLNGAFINSQDKFQLVSFNTAPSRLLITDLENNGQIDNCPKLDISFRYVHDDRKTLVLKNVSSVVTSRGDVEWDASLPKFFTLDKGERFEFQVMILTSNWNQAKDIKLHIQMSTSSGVSFQQVRSHDYTRKAIVYDVIVKPLT
jgi:hypothetical protein